MLRLRRLRFANAEPLAILENYLPEDLADIGQSDLEARGLYQLMRAKGVHIRVAKQRIGATRRHRGGMPAAGRAARAAHC